VQCLFVSQTDGRSRTRVREEGVLRDMAELAERYDVTLSTRISARAEAAAAILRQARQGFAMIVMGASARPGDELYFGNTANAVLQGSGLPVLILAT
jgi:nucleotide-binding universal stress UspA family protein